MATLKEKQEAVQEMLGGIRPILDLLEGISPEDVKATTKTVLSRVVPMLREIVLACYDEKCDKAWVRHVAKLRSGLVDTGCTRDEALAIVLAKISTGKEARSQISRSIGQVKWSGKGA